MDNRFDKVSYELVRRRAKAVTDGLRKYGNARREEALEAADLIEHLLRKQEYLNVEQWIGGYFMGYEYHRQRRGWNPMLWLRAWRAKRNGFAQLRRVNFGDKPYERKDK